MMTHALSRWVWRHGLALLLTLAGCMSAQAGVKVMVEVGNPQEEDFVVVCEWHGTSFGLHSAPLKLLTEKPFLAKAGEIVDCGWSAWSLWPGSGVSAVVYHPIYRPTGTSWIGEVPWIRHASVKDASGREVPVIVVRPRTYQAWIDEVVAEYAGKGELTDLEPRRFSRELSRVAGAMLTVFEGDYYRYYRDATGRFPGAGEYHARYAQRMIEIVSYASKYYDGIEGRKVESRLLETPEESLERWWVHLEKDRK